jgi:hypothetical protein
LLLAPEMVLSSNAAAAQIGILAKCCPGPHDTFYVGKRGRNSGRAEIKVERID